jgi:exopolysaccharide production protein ExoZ
LNHVLLEVTWTLSYELYFYLLFSLLIWLVKPGTRFGIVLAATLLLLIFNLYRHLIADSFGPDNIYYLSFWDQFLNSPFLLEFFCGALLAWGLAKRPDGPATSWFLAGCMLFLLAGWINVSWYSGLIEQGFHVVPRVLVFGIPACLILGGLVRMEAKGLQAPKRFSVVTGGASYAIYLSHILILTVIWNIGFNELVSAWSANMLIAAYLGLILFILAFSVFHYSFLEKPLHQLFKRWLGLGSGKSKVKTVS